MPEPLIIAKSGKTELALPSGKGLPTCGL